MSLTIGMFSIYKLNKDNLAPGGRLILTSGTNIKSTLWDPGRTIPHRKLCKPIPLYLTNN